ncbi:hypothetical protein [Intrasporangium flavum]|uniref:hypothetical protein n=1 Tax=Intrasporangium flavum TaxID=1428657 RepID=UPI00096FC245|nr:hypothetical protein [Intrasporangium flavum]
MTRDPRPARRARTPALAVAALAALAVVLGGCQKETPMSDPTSSADASASACEKQPGDVSVLRGGTFPLDAAATLRAGLQYEVKADPRTWKVMFMGAGVSESHDLAAGDTVTVAGHTVTVRDACADKIVLTLGDGGSGATG